MYKNEFLAVLKNALSGLPEGDVDERLAFYAEMIDDRMEEGASESEAVAGIGSAEEIAAQVIAETPMTKLVKERIKPSRGLRAWEIALLVLGAPLWFPLLVAAGAVVLSMYVVLWSLIAALWAAELALCAFAAGGIVTAAVYFFKGHSLPGIATLGVALLAAGASVFAFYGCAAATKGIVNLTKKAARGIKTRLVRKDAAK